MSVDAAEVHTVDPAMTLKAVCMNPKCPRHNEERVFRLGNLGDEAVFVPAVRCRCNIHAEMKVVELGGVKV